ncbi:uncharacterized protein A4U43_C07F29250 [Asparagus officinalis]|uniref:Syntaxin 6/10/61 N-terminal domain-containing protein n=1 Tax=Asparagus officinalis TaxID=4686 RepID=A0A5P1EHS8_ASPOF|nr:uncharacterized protein LOC109848573 [Asparagus officinalis]ONK64727.1 uncharacterized protein A4U43_C07F29250 [Asparagus officinalis]
MTTCFDRWEKDPFFAAAEEVQESADRMESVYRRWIHEKREAANPSNETFEVSSELLRELQMTVGTAKWQLDELSKAVRSNDDACSAGEETRTRHKQFVDAIGNQISTVENSLRESKLEKGEGDHSWVKLDKGERDELALFLACPLPTQDIPKGGRRSNETLKNNSKEERVNGHRRTASACADMSAWKISVPKDDQMPSVPPPKMPSFSCLLNDLESSSKVQWSKNVFRKLKGVDPYQQDDSESLPLRDPQLSRGCNACYEKTKSCLSSCGHETYDKQLYGWFGALQRQLQRSQYQIRYARPVQMISLAVVIVLSIVFLAFRAI